MKMMCSTSLTVVLLVVFVGHGICFGGRMLRTTDTQSEKSAVHSLSPSLSSAHRSNNGNKTKPGSQSIAERVETVFAGRNSTLHKAVKIKNATTTRTNSKSTFKPLHGFGYDIYRPYSDKETAKSGVVGGMSAPALIASPEVIIGDFKNTFTELDQITLPLHGSNNHSSVHDRAKHAYTEFILSMVTAKSYGSAEKSVEPTLNTPKAQIQEYNETARENGLDNSYLGMTMVGVKRCHNMESLLLDVFKINVPGAVMETGVWRGGLSVYARAVMRAHKQNDRYMYVCDSFAGLPPGDARHGSSDVGWDNTQYLEVSAKTVEINFRKLRLLDNKVVFVKGFFNNTMPVLSKMMQENSRNTVKKLAILRLDGDIYQSTADVLYHMYEHVSVGGYVIIYDWFGGFTAKEAVENFFHVHKKSLPNMIKIDHFAVYWQKTEEITVNYVVYRKSSSFV